MKIGKFNIEDKYWLDSDTFVVITDDHIDKEGISFNFEIEYHEDEKTFVFLAVYDEEIIEIAIYKDELRSYKEEYSNIISKDDIDLFIITMIKLMKNEK